MRTISCKLEDLKTMTLHIGYESENDYTSVRIDAGSVFAEYPQAVPSLKVQPPKGSTYPVNVTRDGTVVIWNVKESDTANNGNGEGQLTFTDGEVVKKCQPFKIIVHRSLKGNGTAPDPVKDWIEEASGIVEAAEEAAQNAEAAAAHAPMIGLDGYWYRWDAEAEEYVSTGTQAQGPEGEPGQPGEPGDPTELIDDTAGAGVTNKTLSADKLAEKFGDVLNAIEGMRTATSGDVGKALSPKTVSNGKVTEWQFVEGGGGSVDPQDIEQAVDTWLDENITNPNSPPLDRSLSSSASAAPADMLGDQEEEILRSIGNKVIYFIEGKYIATNGATVDVTDIKTSSSGGHVAVIDVEEGDQFTINCTGGITPRAYCWIDNSGNVIENADQSVSYMNTILTAPLNAKKLVLNGKGTDDPSYYGVYMKDIVNRLDEEAYENTVGLMIPTAVYDNRLAVLTNANKIGLTSNNNFMVYEFFLLANNEYTIKGSTQTYEGFNMLYATTAKRIPAPTTEYGDAVTPITYYQCASGESQPVIKSITPSVDCYIYIVNRKAENSDVQCYGLRKVNKADDTISRTLPLFGKKIVNFGDSIFGNFRRPFGNSKSISAMIADKTGATVYNAGFGGCRMMENDDTVWSKFSMEALADAIANNDWTEQDAAIVSGAGTLPTYFADALTMLEGIDWSEIDIITIAYGTNDFTSNISLANFSSAIDNSLETLLTAYPHIKVYIISPMFRWWGADDGSDTHTNGTGKKLTDFVDACKEEATKYHVGYIDTYYNLGINLINRLNYFGSDDGAHPNAKGRQLRADAISGVLINS